MEKNSKKLFGGEEAATFGKDEKPLNGALEIYNNSKERERFLEEMRFSLFQCGWRDEMKSLTMETIESSGGLSEINMEKLSSEMIKKGKSLVPEDVKISIIQKVKEGMMANEK
jgi:hypothetical protein